MEYKKGYVLSFFCSIVIPAFILIPTLLPDQLITGEVRDSQNSAIEGVRVTLFRNQQAIASGYSNDEGIYSVEGDFNSQSITRIEYYHTDYNIDEIFEVVGNTTSEINKILIKKDETTSVEHALAFLVALRNSWSYGSINRSELESRFDTLLKYNEILSRVYQVEILKGLVLPEQGELPQR